VLLLVNRHQKVKEKEGERLQPIKYSLALSPWLSTVFMSLMDLMQQSARQKYLLQRQQTVQNSVLLLSEHILQQRSLGTF